MFAILSKEIEWCSFKVFQCGPGYICDESETGKCKIKDESLNCAKDQYIYNQWVESQVPNNCTEYDWEKKCTPNGHYQRSQSKSSRFTIDDSHKFCVDPEGNRIFGDSISDPEGQNSNIQCRCSQKVWEPNQQDRSDDVMIHCQGRNICSYCLGK